MTSPASACEEVDHTSKITTTLLGDHDLVPILFGLWGLVPHSQLLPNCGRLNTTMLCTMVERHVAVLVKVGQIEGSKGQMSVLRRIGESQ